MDEAPLRAKLPLLCILNLSLEAKLCSDEQTILLRAKCIKQGTILNQTPSSSSIFLPLCSLLRCMMEADAGGMLVTNKSCPTNYLRVFTANKPGHAALAAGLSLSQVRGLLSVSRGDI